MRRRAHLFMAVAVTAVLAASLPAGAEDTVSLRINRYSSPPVRYVSPSEDPPVYKHGVTYGGMSVDVVGPDHDKVNRVRVLIGGVEVSGHAGRPTGPIDPGGGAGGRPRGAFYDLHVPMNVRDLCGATEATAEAVYRDERVVRAASGKRIYIDCRPPTLRIESPTRLLCVKYRETVRLQITATDDVGLMSLEADLGRLGHFRPYPERFFPAPKSTFSFTESFYTELGHGSGEVIVRVEVTDWAGGRVTTEFPIVLDGRVPPTITMSRPYGGQRISTGEPIVVEGLASDPGCGLDRVEIGARRAGRIDLRFQVLMTVRALSPEGYRVSLPPETLAPGRWELGVTAFAKTGRSFGLGREIEVFRPSPAPTIPGIRPTIPPFPLRLPQPVPPRKP